jgi:hypothetical protein
MIPIKIQKAFFFYRNRKTNLEFLWTFKRLSTKTILRKESKARCITLSDFKIYHKATINKHFGTGIKTNI